MTFAKPLYLIGLWLVPVLAIWLTLVLRGQRNLPQKLGDSALVRQLMQSVNWSGRRWKHGLWLIGLLLGIVALARPQWGTASQIVQQQGVEVMIALDISESMLAEDLRPNRLTRAKQTIVELMDSLNGDEVGVVLFSGASFIQFPLTSDYNTAKTFLDNANPSMISRSGTVIGDAIRTAMSGFNFERTSTKVIVVMTDGEDHETNPVDAAIDAAAQDVLIYTIGFGTPEGAKIPVFERGEMIGFKRDRLGNEVVTQLEEEALTVIAATASGSYYRATPSGSEVDALLADIARLDAAELDRRVNIEAVERYQWFLTAAILCFLAAEFIPDRKTRKRKPASSAGTAVAMLCLVLGGCASLEAQFDQTGAELLATGNERFDEQQYQIAQGLYAAARAAMGNEAAEPVYNIANTQYRQEKYDEAVRNIDQALPLTDGDLTTDSHYNRGNYHFQQQLFDTAIEDYKAALRRDPADLDAKYNLELALQQIADNAPEDQNDESQGGGDGEDEEQEQEQDQEEEQDNEEEQDDAGQENEEQQNEQGDQPEQPEDEQQQNDEQEGQQEEEEQPAEPEEEEQQEQESDPAEQDDTADEQPAEPQTSDEQQGDTGEGSGGQPQPFELSQEQARQLLEGAGQQAQTLQERLQQIFSSPGQPPEKDW